MEKRFPPSKKRLLQARRDGNSAKSQYVTQVAVAIVMLTVVIVTLGLAWVRLELLLEYLLTKGLSEPFAASRRCIFEALKVVVVVLSFGAFTGVLLEVWQGGLFIEPSLAAPRFERLNPAAGLCKIASSLKEVPLVLLRFLAVGLVLLPFLYYLSFKAGSFLNYGPAEQISLLVIEAGKSLVYGFAVLLVFAVIDVKIRRRRFQQTAGMSLDDLRREHKDEEGDPHLRAARKARHKELSFEDVVKRVRESRVIVVAPREGK